MPIDTGYIVNTAWVRIYADMGSGVWLAPAGTAGPLDLGPPAAAFKSVGWLNDDGIDLEIEKDIEEFTAVQGGSIVIRKVTKAGQKYTFTALEESLLVRGLVYADQPITVTGTGESRFAKQLIAAAQNRTVTRASLVDSVSGDILDRDFSSMTDITFQGTIPKVKNTPRQYAFEATILAGSDAYNLSNNPALLGP